ncbi:uncharacterized protein [Venturia canescens]|uniref:uncharacterized protein n=1 Tax=Venturia canescens TaxID=32260 RepID=UPI001C9C5BD9|nr:uncharacterized protein LOC122410891 [Venturia canescens]
MRDLKKLYERELSTEFPEKPRSLPLTSPEQINDFEAIPDDEYKNVVRYLGSLGGHTLVETANEILKNAMEDSVSPALTWLGRKPNEIALGKTRFAKALYAAVARNRNYPKPDWSQFTDAMTNALRSSKQRHRNSLNNAKENQRGPRGNVPPNDQPRRIENRTPSHSQTHDGSGNSDIENVDEDMRRRNRSLQRRTRNNAAHQRSRQRNVSRSSSDSMLSSASSGTGHCVLRVIASRQGNVPSTLCSTVGNRAASLEHRKLYGTTR